MKTFAQLATATVFATVAVTAIAGPASAGERERAVIADCYYVEGVQNTDQMAECTGGLYVPIPVLRQCLQGGPCFPQVASRPVGRPMNRPDRGMGVDLSPFGPMAGAATTGALTGMGVPKPLAGWAGSRVDANTQAAGRERNLPNAAIRTFTGVSPVDIENHGILGGPNSEARKIFGGLFK